VSQNRTPNSAAIAEIPVISVVGVASIVAVLRIPREAIDNHAARGLSEGDPTSEAPRGFSVLFACKPLLVLAAALALLHLGNGAMLPLYGLAVVAANKVIRRPSSPPSSSSPRPP
jgi:hypothetical protein